MVLDFKVFLFLLYGGKRGKERKMAIHGSIDLATARDDEGLLKEEVSRCIVCF